MIPINTVNPIPPPSVPGASATATASTTTPATAATPVTETSASTTSAHDTVATAVQLLLEKRLPDGSSQRLPLPANMPSLIDLLGKEPAAQLAIRVQQGMGNDSIVRALRAEELLPVLQRQGLPLQGSLSNLVAMLLRPSTLTLAGEGAEGVAQTLRDLWQTVPTIAGTQNYHGSDADAEHLAWQLRQWLGQQGRHLATALTKNTTTVLATAAPPSSASSTPSQSPLQPSSPLPPAAQTVIPQAQPASGENAENPHLAQSPSQPQTRDKMPSGHSGQDQAATRASTQTATNTTADRSDSAPDTIEHRLIRLLAALQAMTSVTPLYQGKTHTAESTLAPAAALAPAEAENAETNDSAMPRHNTGMIPDAAIRTGHGPLPANGADATEVPPSLQQWQQQIQDALGDRRHQLLSPLFPSPSSESGMNTLLQMQVPVLWGQHQLSPVEVRISEQLPQQGAAPGTIEPAFHIVLDFSLPPFGNLRVLAHLHGQEIQLNFCSEQVILRQALQENENFLRTRLQAAGVAEMDTGYFLQKVSALMTEKTGAEHSALLNIRV